MLFAQGDNLPLVYSTLADTKRQFGPSVYLQHTATMTTPRPRVIDATFSSALTSTLSLRRNDELIHSLTFASEVFLWFH